ncbi:oligosaccharide flippase family protein [Acinetobacter sp.]|uniref:lipopolysaccharide biosynthesis protein n=1 Tax=Acinetobacter sp. TaxID=472 RepID=UPI0033401DBD
MDKVTKNIVANYLGKLWGFVSIFIFVRLYIDLLGIESYAIINFYTVILGLLVFADAGLTATLTRELARDIDIETKANLVYTFERIYLGICFLLMALVVVFAGYIAKNFLKSDLYSIDTIAYFLRLIGVGVALQLFSTLYEGGLNGLQHQVLSNKVKIIWSAFRSGIVLIPLYFIPKLEIYFWWQVICNIVLLFIFRNLLYSYLATRELVFSIDLFKSVSKYALGMMGIAFISAINIQSDKLITSKYLGLTEFGYYSIASTLAQVPTIIASPIVISVFPLFTSYVSQFNIDKLSETYHKYSFLITAVVAPVAFCIAFYSIPLITLWTGKPEISLATNYVVKFLVLGGFFLCMQLTPFYLALANGFTKINLYLGVVCLMTVIPLMIFSIKNYGMLGATVPWLFVNLISFFIIGLYVVNRFLAGHTFRWLMFDIFLPTLITIVIGVFVISFPVSMKLPYAFIIESIVIGLSSVVINIMIYNKCNPSNKLFNLVRSGSK